MSEADSPNDQSGSLAPTEPVELTAAIDSTAATLPSPDTGAGWQTIDFPGAMSLDAIPCSAGESVEEGVMADGLPTSIAPGVMHYGNAEITPSGLSFAISAEPPDEIRLRQQLQTENAALRDRLGQAELDLVQQQIEWQLESARLQLSAETAVVRIDQTTDPAAAIVPLSTAEPIDERLHQLLQALERSHQTVQRQQILVETLTEQLASSQERIAQLERDCALTQQRHNEQVQQVLQAEGVCRDLRLRLHRQQQQTLQFKAALEKCLEMPAVYGQPGMPDLTIDDSAEPLDAFAALLPPKNQPVKPWSLPRRAADALESEPTELLKPLFKLLNGQTDKGADRTGLPDTDVAMRLNTPFGDDQRDMLPTATEPSALLESDDPEFVTHLMQLIFPAPAEPQAYAVTDAQAEPIFDLSPAFKTEEEETEETEGTEKETENATQSAVEVTTEDEVVAPGRSPGAITPLEEANEPQEAAMQSLAAITIVPMAIVPMADDANDRSTESQWEQLQALIAPPATVASAEMEPDVEVEASPAPDAFAQPSVSKTLAHIDIVPMENRSKQPVLPTHAGITPLFATPVESSLANVAKLNNASDSANQPIAAWTWRDRLAKASPTPRSTVPEEFQNPTRLLALSAMSQEPVGQAAMNQQPESQQPVSQQPVSVASLSEPAPVGFSTLTPSPIIYPRRSTKKLASLAAVDLPTFPKR